MAVSVSNVKADDIDWLYPELLTKDGLIYILRQRFVQTSRLEDLDKDELLEIYYKYIIPLPQRRYRPNRRGREMTRSQISMSKKRRIEAPGSQEPPRKKAFLVGAEVASRFSMATSDLSAPGDRLKPPPSCIDPKRKVIKLGGGSKKTLSVSPSKSPTHDIPVASKKIVKISMSTSSETSLTDNKSTSNITNNLINSRLEIHPKPEDNGDVEMELVEDEKESVKETEAPPKKMKLKRIAWP